MNALHTRSGSAYCPFSAALLGIGQGPCLPMPAWEHVLPCQHGAMRICGAYVSMEACVPRPAWSRASPGPHGAAWRPCPHGSSRSRGTMGKAWTCAVMASGRVQASMGTCVSVAARTAARLRARMGPGGHDVTRAVPDSPCGSMRA